MPYILEEKAHFLILSNNIINNENVGTNLYVSANIIDMKNETTNDDLWRNIFININSNNDYKNRIILSANSRRVIPNTTTPIYPGSLITKNNIKNNMKFLFDSSNNKNGKILFVKNLDTTDNLNNHLYNNLIKTNFENNQPISIRNVYSALNRTILRSFFPTAIPNSWLVNRYIYHLNYYFGASDIYQINIRDYLYKYASELSNNMVLNSYSMFSGDICYNRIGYTINNINNDFSFLNTTIDSSNIINYNSNNYTTLLIDNSYINLTNGNGFISDNCLNILQKDINYSIYRNISCYNKLTLDYKHVNYYDISINNNFILNPTTSFRIPLNYLNLSNNIIKTFLIRTNNLSIFANTKSNSKIIFNLKYIHLNNIKVLEKNSNLYYKDISFNNTTQKLIDASNVMFLTLDKQLTGITQHDIYNHVHFSYNASNKLVLNIKKNINTENINNNSKFTSLIPSLNNYYLLDVSFNYTNNSHNINNTIKYNNVLYNSIQLNIGKVFNLNFKSYFDFSTNNYYTNFFNDLAIINNNFRYSTGYNNDKINIKFKNILSSENIKFKNRQELLTNYFPINLDNGYDFRYNYNKSFEVSNNLDIVLLLDSLNLKNNYFLDYYGYGYGLLNFYSLTINSIITVDKGSDFTNVDCVYIYHDPINDPDVNYRYPNNNIEIKVDTEIDTLSSIIEQYRGSGGRTSTTNAAFIPAQNGSNLSRKMIQGIIGLNNIPKLLSIEPYDSASITGRGFINQFQIEDTCITSVCDKIAVKQNAIKHDSVKNNRIYSSNSLKKQNFANIVKSNVRNKLSQDCITKIQSANSPIINIPCTDGANVKKYTPFVLFTKGRGNYLGP
jgi:hypothetical protein